MPIRKFRAARVNGIAASDYVGQHGDIFWDEDLGTFKLSNGVTPGGNRIVLNAEDINLAFGDFVANVNSLSTIHPNEDFNILSNGTGTVNVVGQFHVHPTDSGTGLQMFPYFQVNNYGEVVVCVATPNQHDGGLTVTGNPMGTYVDPNNTGVLIHLTGQPNDPSRIYNDGQNTYAAYIGRRYNTSTALPSQVKSGNIVSRLGATPYTDSGWPTISTSRIDMVATQDQTQSALGSRIEFWTTPTNSNVIARTGYIDNTNGITATQFTGNVVGTVITSVQPNITSVGTLTSLAVSGNTATAGFMSGKYIRSVRNAGTIADGGTLTIDFSTDAIVYCNWANGMTVAYSNHMTGRVVKVMCTKAAGSGTDNLDLGGVTASQVSSGSTTVIGTAGATNFLEITCVNGSIGGVFIKV